MHRIAREMKDIDLHPLELSLLDVNDPLVRIATEQYHRYPDQIPRRLGEFFGGISIEDGYLYPLFHDLQPAPVV